MSKRLLSGQHDTPRKSRLKGIVDYCDAKAIPYYKTDVFQFVGIGSTQGYEILKQDNVLAD
jgi:hypothetical protein